jgi:uncharacterized membrane protein
MIAQNKRLIGIVLVVAFLLLIPLVAGFPWSRFDFVVAGVLLLGTGLAIELVLRKVKRTSHRLAICAGILVMLFVVWAELAVGLIGTPLAGS